MELVRPNPDHLGMTEPQLHLIEDDLADGSVDRWADEGLRAIETYLAKHAAFLSFLEADEF